MIVYSKGQQNTQQNHIISNLYKHMKKILLGTLLTLFLAVGTVSAQTIDTAEAGMLPNSPFYFFETLSERIGTLLTFGKIKKAEKHLKLASERLAESNVLADSGDLDKAEKTVEKYQERIDEALEKAGEARTEGDDTDEVLEKIAEITARHQAVLASVYEKAPVQAKEAIRRVMVKSAQGHDIALSAISKEKQKEVRDRIKEETKDDEDKLDELRKLGLPVPEMDTKDDDDNDDDLVDEIKEMEPKDLDSGMMEEAIKLENELR